MNRQRKQPRMYSDLTRFWPIICPVRECKEESEFFARVIKDQARSEVTSLLHLGCGGGHNDYYLKRHFRLTGVDRSPAMLRRARRLNPGVKYWLGDMRTIRLPDRFDAVAILDSIAHMTTENDLRAAFATAYAHLKPGGVFLTFVEKRPSEFRQNAVETEWHIRNGVGVTLVEHVFDPDPSDTSFESTFVYLVRQRGRLRLYADRFECGIFPLRVWVRLLHAVGFRVRRLEFNHTSFSKDSPLPLFVGRRGEDQNTSHVSER